MAGVRPEHNRFLHWMEGNHMRTVQISGLAQDFFRQINLEGRLRFLGERVIVDFAKHAESLSVHSHYGMDLIDICGGNEDPMATTWMDYGIADEISPEEGFHIYDLPPQHFTEEKERYFVNLLFGEQVRDNGTTKFSVTPYNDGDRVSPHLPPFSRRSDAQRVMDRLHVRMERMPDVYNFALGFSPGAGYLLGMIDVDPTKSNQNYSFPSFLERKCHCFRPS